MAAGGRWRDGLPYLLWIGSRFLWVESVCVRKIALACNSELILYCWEWISGGIGDVSLCHLMYVSSSATVKCVYFRVSFTSRGSRATFISISEEAPRSLVFHVPAGFPPSSTCSCINLSLTTSVYTYTQRRI